MVPRTQGWQGMLCWPHHSQGLLPDGTRFELFQYKRFPRLTFLKSAFGTLDEDPATFLDVEFGKGKGHGHGKEEGPTRRQKKAGNTLPAIFGCGISISHWSPGIGDKVSSIPFFSRVARAFLKQDQLMT